MLLARDPFFRGMELAYGPDGAVLAIDWSDTGECHEATGVHRTSGRIFRIAHGSDTKRPPQDLTAQDLAGLSCVALAELATHTNEWYPRQARIILADRAVMGSASDLPQAHETLRRLAASTDPVVACRAVLTLHASGGCDQTFLRGLIAHPDEHLRAWGVRLLGDDWPIDGVIGPATISPESSARVAAAYDAVAADLHTLAMNDPSGLVRLAVASTLQRMPVGSRADLAAALMTRGEDADDHNLPLLVWYGMIPAVETDPRRAADVAIATRWPKTQRLIARRLASLIERHPEGMERLVAAIADTRDENVQQNLLAGIADGLSGWRRAPKPAGWDALAKRLSQGDATRASVVRDLSAVFGDGRAIDEIRRLVLDDKADAGLRLSALETLVRQGGDSVRGICLGLLGDRRFNMLAAEGLSRSDDAEVAQSLVAAYGRFTSPARPKLIGILASRRTFATSLLDAVADGKIPRDAITAYDLRQIRSLGDPALDARIERDWGGVAEATADKRRRIDSLKESLGPAVLAAADASHGRRLFETSCGRCHKLFGAGESIGPDLTGGNRTNIDYLLENIVDPSGVVNRDYRMSIVALSDGRVLNGLVTARDDRTLTLVTPTDRHVIPAEDIDEVTVTQQSPMPEGMLDQLSADAIRDLIGYLMQPAQVPLR
jgi:putative heme-binding domain-containing protein